MGADFGLGADLLGMGIAIVGDRFFVPERVLLPDLAMTFFFPPEVDAGLELAAVFFFLVGVPICMFVGIFDFEESRTVCCGC